MTNVIEVALALVWRGERLLVTRRPPGVHLAGCWEFPGGKLRAGESPERAAEREVLEEVGVACAARTRRAPLEYAYPERRVKLWPIDCDYVSGEAQPLEVAELAWMHPRELDSLTFPPANAPLLAELAAGR